MYYFRFHGMEQHGVPFTRIESLIPLDLFNSLNESTVPVTAKTLGELALIGPRLCMNMLLGWTERNSGSKEEVIMRGPVIASGVARTQLHEGDLPPDVMRALVYPSAERLDSSRSRLQFIFRELLPELDDPAKAITSVEELDRTFDAARILFSVSSDPEDLAV
jgi:hypothetical protein